MSSLLESLSETPIENANALAKFLASSCTPKEKQTIAVSIAAFPYRVSSYTPVGYYETRGLSDFLAALAKKGWSLMSEDNFPIGVRLGETSLTLLAGGQINITGSPMPDLHKTSQEFDSIIAEINHIAEPLDIAFAGIGFHPSATGSEIPAVPGSRYRIMREAMTRRHARGLDILHRTCGTNISLGYTDEADMVKKFRIAAILQPIATALFASSPFIENMLSNYQSPRMHARLQLEDPSSALLPLVFEEGFGFERYTEWALDQPLLYVEQEGRFLDAEGGNFRNFLEGKLSCLPQQKASLGDWQRHLKSLVADTCLTPSLNLRGTDSGPAEMMQALAGYWTGILYDERAASDAWALIKDWNYDDAAQLRIDTPRLGFDAEIKTYRVADLAQATLNFAIQGLRRRAIRLNGGPDEGRYPQVMLDYTESNQNRAGQFRMQAERFDTFTIRKLFDSSRLLPPAIAGSSSGIDFA